MHCERCSESNREGLFRSRPELSQRAGARERSCSVPSVLFRVCSLGASFYDLGVLLVHLRGAADSRGAAGAARWRSPAARAGGPEAMAACRQSTRKPPKRARFRTRSTSAPSKFGAEIHHVSGSRACAGAPARLREWHLWRRRQSAILRPPAALRPIRAVRICVVRIPASRNLKGLPFSPL